ncbi:MAG: cation:proton antiporter [Nocardioidaceae bacterium]|nr:cation:proton antiporter [Nocardioidaceae bacterium]NUS52521.1 cation:proton antiporter [Nocardioidaceae bacterium]
MEETASSLLLIVACSVLAPLLAGLVPRRLLPEVVVLLVLGVLIGPHVLGLASTVPPIELLRQLGLGLLFLLAGYEIELDELRGTGGRRAMWTWLVCLGLALGMVALLGVIGTVHAEAAVAIALTSTALGTLLPILKDSGRLETPLGGTVLHHGAFGELGPVAAMALLLGSRDPAISLVVLIGFAVLALLVSVFAQRVQRVSGRVVDLVRAGAETTGQTLVRLSMLLLVLLGSLALAFELDVVLGAFAAGIVLRQLLPSGHERLELRLNGIAFGFFIPVFFVTSGMAIDPAAVASKPGVLLVFVAMILVLRGGLVYLAEGLGRPATYRPRERVGIALYAATGLPIIVAVTSTAVSAGSMSPANASVLVAGGALTVLLCPMAATLLLGEPAAVDES